MATTSASGDECSITVVEPTAHADAAGGRCSRESCEKQQRESWSGEEKKARGSRGRAAAERSESSAAMVRKKLDNLNMIVLCVAFLEWAGNTVGTVSFIWATVVLLGGFCSLLSRMDFWFSAIMVFMEGSRVFIRNDASINQWLFGSTGAFRWKNLSSSGAVEIYAAKWFAVVTGVGISFTPIEARPEIVAGILKLALLVTFSQLQTGGIYAQFTLLLVVMAVFFGGVVGYLKLVVHYIKRSNANHIVSFLKILGMSFGWLVGIGLAVLLVNLIVFMGRTFLKNNPIPRLCIKVIIASGLACLPFLQAILPSYYRYISMSIALVIFSFELGHTPEGIISTATGQTLYVLGEQTISSIRDLLLHILETILPILFIWSLMYPLPGISLKLSFYMLCSVIAGVLIANLQIPVAFLQVLLSVMRLRGLLGHGHHDYNPLPQDASPNLVPSIVVFYVMELCQGSSYILATILGLISIFYRIWLVRDLKFEKKWGANAVNLYHQQAYQARTVKGLLSSEKSTPSLHSFAIECLNSTSSEIQFVGLRILDTFLQQWDPESKRELIVEMTSTSKKAVPTLIHMLRSTFAGDEFVIRLFAASVIAELTGNIKISEFPGMVKLISSLLDAKNQQDSLPPTEADIFQAWYSPKLSEFPGVVKLISSFLDPENQQNSLLNVVPKNNGGSQSICNTDESAFLQRMLCPLMGMSLLQKLAGDPDNCAELVEEASYITTKTLGLIIYLTSEEICGDQVQNKTLRPTLNFAGWLASNRGKIGARFCQELSENPFLLNSLKRILDLEDCQPELWKLAIDVIAKLALDEAASQEIGSTQSIIHKLMQAFLMPNDVCPSRDNDR